MLDQQGMGHDPRTPTVRQVREVCTQREPTERVIIVIVAERRERKRETREERKRETREEKGRERTRERERRDPPPPFLPPSLLPVCRFKTLPCVGSKRFRVWVQNARMFKTCARFEPTHGSVLNLHTRDFQRATHHHTTTAHHTAHTPRAPRTPHARHTTQDTTHDTTHTKHKHHIARTHHHHNTHQPPHTLHSPLSNAWTRTRRSSDHDPALDKNL